MTQKLVFKSLKDLTEYLRSFKSKFVNHQNSLDTIEDFIKFIQDESTVVEKLENPKESKKETFEKELKESIIKDKISLSVNDYENDLNINPKDTTLLESKSEQNKIVSQIKDLIEKEKKCNNRLLIIKMYLGKYLLYLQRFYYDLTFEEILKQNNINYCKSEGYFCIAIYKLIYEYPVFKNVSIPLRRIKNNMKLIREILENDKSFWSPERD